VKHIKTYESYLYEQAINEIGEGVTPFAWKRVGSAKVDGWMADMSQHDRSSSSQNIRLPDLEYEFKSDKTEYLVKIAGWFSPYTYINFGAKNPNWKKPHDYDVLVSVAFVDKHGGIGTDKEKLTNYGEQFKVISTVSAILQEVMKELQEIEWIKVKEIYIAPKLEDADEGKPITQTKRGRLYLEYIKKQGSKLKGDWTASIEKDSFVIRSGKWSGGSPGQFIQL